MKRYDFFIYEIAGLFSFTVSFADIDHLLRLFILGCGAVSSAIGLWRVFRKRTDSNDGKGGSMDYENVNDILDNYKRCVKYVDVECKLNCPGRCQRM